MNKLIIPNSLIGCILSFNNFNNNCTCTNYSRNKYTFQYNFCKCGIHERYFFENICKLINNKKATIYIGSYTETFESDKSKERGYDDMDMTRMIRACYDIKQKKISIEQYNYCNTCCINVDDDNITDITPNSSLLDIDSIDIKTMKYLIKNNVRNMKLKNDYIPINKKDNDYNEINFIYNLINKWFLIYEKYI